MGTYVNNHLIKDESVILETNYHWIIFVSWYGLFTLLIGPAIVRWSSEFVITSRRIIIKQGFISRKTFEMNITKIESVNVDQSLIGRLFGYGSITIIGTGGTREAFHNIRKPLEFRKAFQELC
jgi:uncharacterized membrane protein YdbT with pleckstrin-like domain